MDEMMYNPLLKTIECLLQRDSIVDEVGIVLVLVDTCLSCQLKPGQALVGYSIAHTPCTFKLKNENEHYLTLNELNSRLGRVELGYMEAKDRPTPIGDQKLSGAGHTLNQAGVYHNTNVCVHMYIVATPCPPPPYG